MHLCGCDLDLALSTQCAFPDYANPPSRFEKAIHTIYISCDVCSEFLVPEFLVGLGGSAVPATSVAVPETSMNKDYCVMFLKD